ncbi:DUF3696 domain-containing protein [Psychromonas arctica]|uniref:DUF3696 domain-containing protein n=1 Tax=Psychromonas arctica TaxID=168275 RepID=A0ABU9HAT6_9GAMM
MINSITLKNFKCYKKQEFKLSNLTVFCGNNSVGKSTAIQSILLAIQNNFASKLPLNGDFVSFGTFFDIHNRYADPDTITLTLKFEDKETTWGHDLDDMTLPHYESARSRDSLEEQPLPLISDTNEMREWLKETYHNDFQYLCAERWGPRNNYPYSSQRRWKDWLGIRGEYVPQIMSSVTSRAPLAEGDFRLHKNSSTHSLAENLYEWMGEVSPGVFIKSDSNKQADISTNQFQFGDESYRPVNVGFGLSYSLSIVLALLITKPGGLVIIENPEAHLHPRGQSYLGRLIAKTAESGVQIIIETHSDHLLNGIRVAARLSETYKKGFKVFYVSAGKEESGVEAITIGEKGDLSSWPDGFFDQQAMDIRTLMKGKEV